MSILIGQGDAPVYLEPKYTNRHGLIAGATGTGKTVTLQIVAQSLSDIGVPSFVADIKGDLSGISQPGAPNPKFEDRAQKTGPSPYVYGSAPTVFWDLFGLQGHPVRATISEMGPLLLSRLMGLNDTQEGVLNLTFKLADDEGLLLLDLNDLRSMLTFVGENAATLKTTYGNVSSATVGAIQRQLLVMEQQGAESFFGEPALNIADLIRTTPDGKGVVNVLAADRLMQNPRLYSTFLLWLLSELFEEMPEVGDLDKPRLVFFFDEAHLLFSDAPKALVDKVEQVVKLIRSKGVGVFFITQNPADVPESVLAQLGNRFQHALRAYTPGEQKAVRAAASSFRANPAFDTEQAITELGVGEALVSTLQEKGVPSMVQRTMVRPPSSRLGPATVEERARIVASSPLGLQYGQAIDRDSAHEALLRRAQQAAAMAPPAPTPARAPAGSRSDSLFEAAAKSIIRSASSQLGRQVMRGILGSIFKGR
ncbi:MAG: DUF853 family protein [Armatimonadetes bacterium]|nr:DUF853 family protein [Armatimonadota bacterium]